jgi:hypothetical protein
LALIKDLQAEVSDTTMIQKGTKAGKKKNQTLMAFHPLLA